MVCTRKKDYGNPPLPKQRKATVVAAKSQMLPKQRKATVVAAKSQMLPKQRKATVVAAKTHSLPKQRKVTVVAAKGHPLPKQRNATAVVAKSHVLPKKRKAKVVVDKSQPLSQQREAIVREYEDLAWCLCEEFEWFPKLPCELRLMIWQQASMTPRLVAVGPKGIGQPESDHSMEILPSLLSVNKESRYCALRHYTLRFTITLTVDTTGRHRWDCPEFQCTIHHANVVMSSDDTLGLLGWETLKLGYGTKFQVKNANGTRPWENYPTSHPAQPEVKKVAFLGPGIASDHNIVHQLNSVVTWDLDSSLHAQSTRLRELIVPWPPQLIHPAYPYGKYGVLVHSRKFNGSLEDWGKRLIYRVKHGLLPLWSGAPNILAFELGKKPDKIPKPVNFVPARSVEDLYKALPPRFRFEDPR